MYIDCRLVFGVMLKYYCKTKHLLFRIINIFLLNMLLWFKCLMKTSKSRLWRLQTHTPLNLLKTVLEGQLLSKMSVSIHNILFPKSGSHFLQKKICWKDKFIKLCTWLKNIVSSIENILSLVNWYCGLPPIIFKTLVL